MILSTRGRYGLKMMLELALNYGKGAMSLKDIANKQSLSDTYLEHLISPLRKNGLVNSTRGAQGGYELAKPPNEIKAGDVIRVLEGSLAPAKCVLEDEPECSNADYCATRLLYEKITESINNVIDSISLQDMVDDYYTLNNTNVKRRSENE
ncbi:RrF2 family transcriptional regulator [Lutispora thermophila]|uniref:Transcriptional regulator, BadM/Rrf2 family n=1 Tax=Lutispora thermophila DSM 19022 TaxID=1122184 RepID=A0A1M6F1E7_9FIRM|nr:Rrf2 family transcriptional regulator [Lutispora thermophila]SHI91522.1 transcriptional regulator, BadM/Rrf2 family [Lutispora thermophila DSM 19022]